jgi:hypothetical protein
VHSDPAVWERGAAQAEDPRDAAAAGAAAGPTRWSIAILAGLEGTLDAAAAAKPYAGDTKVHRLNRAEYANAVRDLLGVEADSRRCCRVTAATSGSTTSPRF